MEENSAMETIALALKERRCYVCGFHLSVAPISIGIYCSETMYKCGRCEDIIPTNITKWLNSRQTTTVPAILFYRMDLFEDVAKHLLFPCSYSNCHEIIPWDGVPLHENDCPQKPSQINCPMFKKECQDVIPLKELLTHFQSKHMDCIFENDSTVIVNNESERVFIIKENNEIFIVYIFENDKVAVFSTTCIGYTKFDLQIFCSSENGFSVLFSDLPIKPFNERLHCSDCMVGQCSGITDHFFSMDENKDLFTNTMTKLHNALLQNLRSFQKLCFRITIKEDKTEGEDTSSQEDYSNISKKFNKDTLKKALTCPYCMKYLTGPIFTCSAGHTLCEQCKTKLTACPMCQSDISLTRSFTLEMLANDTELSCENEGNGCSFKGNTQRLINHENNCTFKKN